MDVSIIIVNYNTRVLTLQCIESIFKQTIDVDFEIILVDNASSDGSCIAIKEVFPQVKIIESDTNLGFGKANNLGVKSATGKFLFFLNSDTILLNNAVLLFVRFYKNNQFLNIGALGSVLLSPDLKPIHSSSNFPKKSKVLRNIVIHYFDKKYLLSNYRNERFDFGNENYFTVQYITGADLFIRKSFFEKIGGFDSNYFMYFEETDLQTRMQKSNLSRLLIKGPKIVHLEGASSKNLPFSANRQIMVEKSMFFYFKKHSNLKSYIWFRIVYNILRLPILIDLRITLKIRLAYIKYLWLND